MPEPLVLVQFTQLIEINILESRDTLIRVAGGDEVEMLALRRSRRRFRLRRKGGRDLSGILFRACHAAVVDTVMDEDCRNGGNMQHENYKQGPRHAKIGHFGSEVGTGRHSLLLASTRL